MYNWSVDERRLKKNSYQHITWRLEQLINFGIQKEKINRRQLKNHWSKLHLDPQKKSYLAWLLWG